MPLIFCRQSEHRWFEGQMRWKIKKTDERKNRKERSVTISVTALFTEVITTLSIPWVVITQGQ